MVDLTTGIEIEEPQTPSNIYDSETSDSWGWILPDELPPEVTLLDLIREALNAEAVGDPWHFAQFWQSQFLSFNCSVAIQRGILASYGFNVSEGELTEIAIRNGWLSEQGASLSDCGKLLYQFGIETRAVMEGNVTLLTNELLAGNRVIVPLDSGELWVDTFLGEVWEWLEDFFGIADHVIWITGIDMSDPDNPIVIINDTGDPDGAARTYPLSLFMDAWEDADFSYIATGSAPAV